MNYKIVKGTKVLECSAVEFALIFNALQEAKNQTENTIVYSKIDEMLKTMKE